MVFPTLLGAGKRLFGETADAAALRLTDSQVAGDTQILIYEPADAAASSRDEQMRRAGIDES
jgi:dihydrofolate reductase